MDMILLDWTRMGRTYCLAGAILQEKQWCIVRPLLTRSREEPVRIAGWSAYLMDGHQRWEIMELIGPLPADPEPPHLEDMWVRAMRSRRSFATREARRALLTATMAPPNEPLFGCNLATTRAAAYLQPGTGIRSLVTLALPSNQIHFDAAWRQGMGEPDIRVELPLPELGNRWLPVKDHHLLLRGETEGNNLEQRIQILTAAVQQMGEQVAVRLGLSRPFQSRSDQPSMCWVMADGFFSLLDPQP